MIESELMVGQVLLTKFLDIQYKIHPHSMFIEVHAQYNALFHAWVNNQTWECISPGGGGGGLPY